MAFLTSYRAEKVYFEKLRSNIDIAKSYIQRGATDEVMALLQNAVDADGAIMLCYRNLGEVWADLAAQLEKTQKALEDLKTALEEYHDDLNKKIDEINNYLVRLINALDERVTILENESKVKFAYLNHDSVENVYSIEYNGETADFDTLSAALEYPHLLVLIDNENGNIYYPRSVSDVLIDFHADGVSGTDYVDISVTMSDSDVVTVTEKTVVNYTFGTGFNVSNTNEVTPDLNVLQAKLSAGFGIEIDSTNEISVDTNDVQEKLIAGQNITLTPDSTDPTKTVIDAAGGASYTAGEAITIEDNAISAREVGIFEDFGTPFIASQNYTFSLNTNRADTRLELNHDIGTAITYANLIAKIDKYDSMYFNLGSANTSFLQGVNDPLNYVLYNAIVSIKDTSDNREAVLQRYKDTSLLLQHIKNNVDTIASGSQIRIDGIKKLKRWITSGHSYKFHLQGYIAVYSGDGLLARTDFITIVGSVTSLTVPISAYGLA